MAPRASWSVPGAMTMSIRCSRWARRQRARGLAWRRCPIAGRCRMATADVRRSVAMPSDPRTCGTAEWDHVRTCIPSLAQHFGRFLRLRRCSAAAGKPLAHESEDCQPQRTASGCGAHRLERCSCPCRTWPFGKEEADLMLKRWIGGPETRRIGWLGLVVALTAASAMGAPVGSWTATSTVSTPCMTQHTAVWTGSRMIVWGGYVAGSYWNDGCVYDPATDTWTTTSTTGAPSPRGTHTAVWTGSKMIVWGGSVGGSSTNTGGATTRRPTPGRPRPTIRSALGTSTITRRCGRVRR